MCSLTMLCGQHACIYLKLSCACTHSRINSHVSDAVARQLPFSASAVAAAAAAACPKCLLRSGKHMRQICVARETLSPRHPKPKTSAHVRTQLLRARARLSVRRKAKASGFVVTVLCFTHCTRRSEQKTSQKPICNENEHSTQTRGGTTCEHECDLCVYLCVLCCYCFCLL